MYVCMELKIVAMVMVEVELDLNGFFDDVFGLAMSQHTQPHAAHCTAAVICVRSIVISISISVCTIN